MWTGDVTRKGLLGSLPPELVTANLVIDGCDDFVTLPERLQARRVVIRDCSRFESLPADAWVQYLEIEGCPRLASLPEGWAVETLTLRRCPRLVELPRGLTVSTLVAHESSLVELPADITVQSEAELSGSPRLHSLPEGFRVPRLVLRQCLELRQLPDDMDVCELDISGCTRLRLEPESRHSFRTLDLADCVQITSVPEHCGVPVDARVAFQPDAISAKEALAEPNVERRRVMMERIGYARFLAEATPKTIDCDRDRGGDRRLLLVEWEDDEPLVLVSLVCPSTGNQYCIRVPPTMQTCRQAVAWMAGFDDAGEYEPVFET